MEMHPEILVLHKLSSSLLGKGEHQAPVLLKGVGMVWNSEDPSEESDFFPCFLRALMTFYSFNFFQMCQEGKDNLPV
jgi:hypothetical protein